MELSTTPFTTFTQPSDSLTMALRPISASPPPPRLSSIETLIHFETFHRAFFLDDPDKS